MFIRNRRRSLPMLLAGLMQVLVAAQPGDSRPPTDSVRFEAKMDTAMAQLWYQMPQSSMSPNVNLSGQTQPDCADAALRKARFALTEVGIQDAARRAAVQTIDIGKDVLEHALGVRYAGLIGDLAGLYLESGSVDELADNIKKLAAEKAGQAAASGIGAGAGAAGGRTSGAAQTGAQAVEHAMEGYPAEKGAGELAKYLWDQFNAQGPKTLFESTFNDPLCGPIAVAFEMRSAPNGHKSIHFRASGDCSCKWPERAPQPMRLGRFTVVGNGDLAPENPVVEGNTIVINYRLASTTFDVLASCGCPQGESDSGTSAEGPQTATPQTTPEPPKTPVYERICWQRCGHLYELWQEIQRSADRLANTAQQLEQQVSDLQGRLSEAQQHLQDEQAKLQRAEQGVHDLEAQKGHPAVNQTRLADRLRAANWNLKDQQGRTSSAQYRVNELQRELQDTQPRAERMRQMANQRAAEAAQARDAYYRCVASCYEQARQAGEISVLPDDVQEWQRTHPQPPPPPPAEQRTGSQLIGVVIGTDTRTGEKTTARIVSDPKTYRGIPGVRVVEMTTNVALGKDGKPLLDGLQARIGDGPAQSCEKPVTGTVAKGAKTMQVSVGRPGTTPVTQEVPVSPGETRSAPVSVRPQDFHTPAVYQTGTVQVIHGPFDGSSFGTSVQVAGRPAEIVAETAGALYFRVPEGAAPGQTAVVCEEQGTRMRFKVATVGLSMSADRLSLMKGESTSFRATVTGADKLPPSAWQSASAQEIEDVMDMNEVRRLAPKFKAPGSGAPGMILLLLQNATPGVVSMSGGNVVQLELNQQSFAGGPYTHTGSVHSHERGSFGINGVVVPFLAPVEGEAAP